MAELHENIDKVIKDQAGVWIINPHFVEAISSYDDQQKTELYQQAEAELQNKKDQ